MKRYLLNVTFHAGSDSTEDTDRGMYLLQVSDEIDESKMREVFRKVNKLLKSHDIDHHTFPVSYEQGININTFMQGVKTFTKGRLVSLCSNHGALTAIDNYYEIEQWQFEDYFC